MKNQRAITLVALIITIIVLLILVTVSISLVINSGIISKTKSAVDTYSEEEIGEQIKLAYLECETEKLYNSHVDSERFLKNRLKSTFNLEDDKISVEIDKNTVIVTMNGKDYTYTIADGKVESETAVTRIKKSTEIADSYVGYYADIDADGTVDGVIFADLLTGRIKETQQWGDRQYMSYASYSIPTISSEYVKTYYISQESYTWDDITKPVLSPKGSGEKRFYIMELSDFTASGNSKFYWYKNAKGNMIASDTSVNFGTGKTNTKTIIDKWNAVTEEEPKVEAYTDSNQDNQDIWKHIQTKYNEGWFIPSRAEWAAFNNELEIVSGRWPHPYVTYEHYWTSSQNDSNNVFDVFYVYNTIHLHDVNKLSAVRLATTF